MSGERPRPTAVALRVVLPAAVALVVALLLRAFVVGVYRVPTASMAPTLLAGDRLLVDKLAYRHHPPERGDVVVLTRADGELFVKRVVGLAGDTVRLAGGQLFVDGAEVEREPLGDVQLDDAGEEVRTASFFLEDELYAEHLGGRVWRVVQRRAAPVKAEGPFLVPAGAVFVLGDNRDASTDSRSPSFGPVPLNRLVGRVERVAFSFGSGGPRWPRSFAPVH